LLGCFTSCIQCFSLAVKDADECFFLCYFLCYCKRQGVPQSPMLFLASRGKPYLRGEGCP
jgi:hypothetical protein